MTQAAPWDTELRCTVLLDAEIPAHSLRSAFHSGTQEPSWVPKEARETAVQNRKAKSYKSLLPASHTKWGLRTRCVQGPLLCGPQNSAGWRKGMKGQLGMLATAMRAL